MVIRFKVSVDSFLNSLVAFCKVRILCVYLCVRRPIADGEGDKNTSAVVYCLSYEATIRDLCLR